MNLAQTLELSYYRQVADIDADHGVYLVQDVRTQKFYVKKLLTVYNEEIYRYLAKHPVANTPRLYLVEEDNGILTVIEEFIPGDTLEEILEKEKTLPEDQVLDVLSQLCAILADFHRCKPAIVNRDIKPSNIKITPDGRVKLLDINAAKRSNDRADRDTVLLGTQGYAAPEQYGFGSSGVQADIYALGVLMNVMRCGVFPHRRLAGGRLGKIVSRCVALSPDARYQSVEQLQEALNELSGKGRGWRKFLPPGFRSGNPFRWLVALLGYALLVLYGWYVGDVSAENPLMCRLGCLVALLCIVLFNGNYMGIQREFALTRHKNRWVRWLGMAVVDFLLMFLWMLTTLLF